MNNFLIVGERSVGKSTLIKKVLSELDISVSGFETVKEDALADEYSGSPLYIYRAGEQHVRTKDNLLGFCIAGKPDIKAGAFDKFAPMLKECKNRGDIILMDEIGFMESSSALFCAAVTELLDSEKPVLAAVKYKNTPLLNEIRSRSDARCFYITEENRNELVSVVIGHIRKLSDKA